MVVGHSFIYLYAGVLISVWPLFWANSGNGLSMFMLAHFDIMVFFFACMASASSSLGGGMVITGSLEHNYVRAGLPARMLK